MTYEKLPAEFKSKWVAALRSGEYRQGKGNLLSDCHFCCLGVAGAICGIPTERLEAREWLDHRYNEYELPEIITGSRDNDVVRFLSDMNDDGKSFSEIADWIEENL